MCFIVHTSAPWVFTRAKKQSRDQTRESLRGAQKYESRNECGFELGLDYPSELRQSRWIWFGAAPSASAILGMANLTKTAESF
jgi:hypothetical protein